MVEIKIYEDGQEKRVVSGKILLVTTLADVKEGIKVESGVIGTGPANADYIESFAKSCADQIVALSYKDKALSIYGGEIFKREFEKELREIVLGGGAVNHGRRANDQYSCRAV